MTAQPPAGLTIVVTIPGNPSRDLSPNASRKLHWSYKHRARQELHDNAYYATKEAIARYESTHGVFVALSCVVDVNWTIAWGHGRRVMDGDNALANCKALWDGMADAGLVENDKQFRFHPVVQIRDKAKVGYVEVVVIAAER